MRRARNNRQAICLKRGKTRVTEFAKDQVSLGAQWAPGFVCSWLRVLCEFYLFAASRSGLSNLRLFEGKKNTFKPSFCSDMNQLIYLIQFEINLINSDLPFVNHL